MLWKIPVTWEMYGCVRIEAETLEEAMAIAEDPDGRIPLPDDGAYVDGSWTLSSTEPEDVRLFQMPQKGQ
ncbi:MAG: hypothetical protein HFF83_13195 [Oscillibacter sp.]|jgi:hypothetical protein|nr:hypothetical protein [Oscillibacter sp.]